MAAHSLCALNISGEISKAGDGALRGKGETLGIQENLLIDFS
jgi:hypothetical protein